MKLNLKNPLIFFDLETTGININTDRIVEISYLKIYPNGMEESKTMKINPECPIPAESSAVHHIYDQDVANCPTFKEVAKTIAKDFESSDFAGYNSNRFDVPLLAEEMLRAGIDFDFHHRKFIDVQTIFHKKEPRTLSAAYKYYCHKELVDAHSAEADTRATYEILMGQLDRYDDIENDVNYLAAYTQQSRNVDFSGRIVYNAKDQEVFNFGKHKDKPVEEVLRLEPGYYNWMMGGDFPLYTKKILTQIKLRILNTK